MSFRRVPKWQRDSTDEIRRVHIVRSPHRKRSHKYAKYETLKISVLLGAGFDGPSGRTLDCVNLYTLIGTFIFVEIRFSFPQKNLIFFTKIHIVERKPRTKVLSRRRVQMTLVPRKANVSSRPNTLES